MDEWGIFSDEGCIEADFYSKEEAEAAIAERYSPEDELHASRVCPEHPDREYEYCEECNAEDGDMLTNEQALRYTAIQNPTEEQLDQLEETIGHMDHEADCPRQQHGAAECQCLRSVILEHLNNNGRNP